MQNKRKVFIDSVIEKKKKKHTERKWGMKIYGKHAKSLRVTSVALGAFHETQHDLQLCCRRHQKFFRVFGGVCEVCCVLFLPDA